MCSSSPLTPSLCHSDTCQARMKRSPRFPFLSDTCQLRTECSQVQISSQSHSDICHFYTLRSLLHCAYPGRSGSDLACTMYNWTRHSCRYYSDTSLEDINCTSTRQQFDRRQEGKTNKHSLQLHPHQCNTFQASIRCNQFLLAFQHCFDRSQVDTLRMHLPLWRLCRFDTCLLSKGCNSTCPACPHPSDTFLSHKTNSYSYPRHHSDTCLQGKVCS